MNQSTHDLINRKVMTIFNSSVTKEEISEYLNLYVKFQLLPHLASLFSIDLDWEYIAYGILKNRFEELGDLKKVNEMRAELEKQEAKINTRYVIQISNQRTPTIYF